MKNFFTVLFATALLAVLSGCGISNALIVNQNLNTTQVQLSGNNFKVVGKVSGSAEVNYVLIFGGIKQKQLYENAYSAMIDKADLEKGSRALINITTEHHFGGYPPFYYKRTVTVSAHVIEFTK